MTRVLKRHAPVLRKIGVEVESSRNEAGGHIRVSLKKVTVESKNLTPHSQYFTKDQEYGEEDSNVQFGKNTVNTVNSGSTDSNDGKKQELSENDDQYIEAVI